MYDLNNLFTLKLHRGYTPKSEYYKDAENIVKYISDLLVSKELQITLQKIFNYNMFGSCKVDWNKICRLIQANCPPEKARTPQTMRNQIEFETALYKESNKTLDTLEQLNPKLAEKINNAFGGDQVKTKENNQQDF